MEFGVQSILNIQMLIIKGNLMKKTYACCFCNEKIGSTKIDITSLIVVFNWDQCLEKQHEQL